MEEAGGGWGGVMDPLPPLRASLVDVRQKQGCAGVGGAGVPSGPARMLALSSPFSSSFFPPSSPPLPPSSPPLALPLLSLVFLL